METLEELKQRIDSTKDLQSVVRTMKALAAVRIRQYERAVESLAHYNRIVEMALRAVLRDRPWMTMGARSGAENQLGAVIFGSDQGMCGQLNDQVVAHALEEMGRFSHVAPQDRRIMVMGERARARLEEAGQRVDAGLSVPGSVSGITPLVQDILMTIETWHQERGLDQVFLYYSKHLTGGSYQPETLRLLPVDKTWLANIGKEKWPNRCLPMFTMAWDPLFSALIRQYLFVSLFRAFAESLASENASRLASMQGAERNVREQMEVLNMQYHQQRQMSITEELLDIVSGFEALEAEK